MGMIKISRHEKYQVLMTFLDYARPACDTVCLSRLEKKSSFHLQLLLIIRQQVVQKRRYLNTKLHSFI